MKYSIGFILSLIIISVYFISSCTDKLPEPSLDCSSNRITYDDHIMGILESNCNTSGCHDNINTDNLGSFGVFSTLSTSRKQDIATQVANGTMPLSGNISSAVADTIRCWQENGYLEN